MISNKEYESFLKSIIACISHGDYFSVKELSYLELDNIEKARKKESKNRKTK